MTTASHAAGLELTAGERQVVITVEKSLLRSKPLNERYGLISTVMLKTA
jgi:hypothetical protein